MDSTCQGIFALLAVKKRQRLQVAPRSLPLRVEPSNGLGLQCGRPCLATVLGS